MSTKTEINTPAIYYVLKGIEKDTQGPFTEEELRQQIASGEITNDDDVTVPGAEKWEPVAKWMERKAAVQEAVKTTRKTCGCCGLEIPADAPSCYMCGRISEIRKAAEPLTEDEKAFRKIIASCFILILGIVLMKTIPATDWYQKRKALGAAKEYVDEKFVIDRMGKAAVYRMGQDQYEVELRVDRRNAMGGPMRNKMVVEVSNRYNDWTVTGFKEEP